MYDNSKKPGTDLLIEDGSGRLLFCIFLSDIVRAVSL